MIAACRLLSLALIFSLSPYAPGSRATHDEAAVKQILQQRIDERKKGVAIVVGLVDEGGSKVVSYGKMGVDDPRPVDGDTVFEIGSISKVFTAILLADMVERGEVGLNDPISKYLPKSVKTPTRNGKEITLFDLATQSSGLPRMPSNFKPKDASNPFADYSVDQMYEFLSGYTLTRDISEKYEYSNFGMGLLGHILALKAGTDYETLVLTRICRPLKMDSTAVKLSPALRARLAVGHNEALKPVKNWDIPTLAGAGALRSTTNDMLKFVAANLGLVKTRLLPAMQVSHLDRKNTGSPDLDIGLAWHIFKRYGTEITWHNGGTGGYRTFIGFDQKRRAGVVVLTNTGNGADDIGFHLLESKYELAKFEPPKARTAISLDPKISAAYVGEYELGPGFIISVSQQDDRFFAQATGQPKFELFPESETEFFLKVTDAQVTFVKDDKGVVTKLILHQGGANQDAKKVK